MAHPFSDGTGEKQGLSPATANRIMADDKPDRVRRLEDVLKRPLHPCLNGSVMDWWNRKCYQLNDAGNITGLNLQSCQIRDWSFLKGLTQLTSLDLSYNEITDGSFLKGLTQLTSLDLSYNKIADGSFLKGLTQLTSLDLSDNEITDWSF